MKKQIHVIAVFHRYTGFFFKEVVQSEVVTEILEVNCLEEIGGLLNCWLRTKSEARSKIVVSSISYCFLPNEG